MIEQHHDVVFLGPEGTFTHEAALAIFPNSSFISQPSIEDVFSMVEQSKARFGVFPIENSSEGVVTHTLDCLINSPSTITGELALEILGSIGGTVKLLGSYPCCPAVKIN